MIRKLTFSLPNRPISRVLHSNLRFRSLSGVASYEQSSDRPEFDRTLGSIRTLSSSPCFALLGMCRNIDSLKKVHALLIVHGLVGDLMCDTKLVSLYGSFGYVGSARSVFDRIRNPDTFSWKVMLRWYFLNDLYNDIVPFYNCSRKCLREVDDSVLSIVLKACRVLRDIDEGKKLHCHIVKSGGPGSFVMTSLVDMYVECGEIDCSRKVFDEIPQRDVVSWTSMILGYVHNDCPGEGLTLFNRMREVVECNELTLGSLVTACTKLRAPHQGKYVHGYVIKNGYGHDPVLGSALLHMYVKFKDIRDARCMFDELRIN